jgi:hypothetical protein
MIHSCHKAAQLISDAMDRRLSLWERFCLRVHLLLCGACRRYRWQLTILREAMKQNPDAEEANVTAPLGADARERIRAALRDNS